MDLHIRMILEHQLFRQLGAVAGTAQLRRQSHRIGPVHAAVKGLSVIIRRRAGRSRAVGTVCHLLQKVELVKSIIIHKSIFIYLHRQRS